MSAELRRETKRRDRKSVNGMIRLQENRGRHEFPGIGYRYSRPNPAAIAVAEACHEETAIRRGSDQSCGDRRVAGEELKIVPCVGR